jgi:cell volume regulation protein A
MTEPTIGLIIGSALVLAGVGASKLSSRLGVPALLLFLAVGMVAGSDGPGGIHFEDFELAQAVGIVALALILFAGGLDTRWDDVRPVLREGVALATVGVLVTAAVAGAVATWAFDLPWETGLLLGAIISSTDAAAVFAVLRSRSVALRGRIRPLLELESGSNDPMAVFLTVGFLLLITEPDTSVAALVPLFVWQMVVGGLLGLAAGQLAVWVLNRIDLDYEGLYPVLTLGIVVFVFSTVTAVQASGFLAVYVLGLVMGRHPFIHRNSLMRFHDAIAWVSQIAMFVVLGLLVYPSELVEVTGRGLLIAVALIVVARPTAVLLTLWPLRVPLAERTLIAWVGLRGAAPIILATFPLMEGIPHADLIFNTVFFIVLTSVLLQGTTIPLVARWLGVSAPLATPSPWPLEVGSAAAPGAELQEVTVATGSRADGRAVVDLGLPAGTMIVLVEHEGHFDVPTGATRLLAGDRLLILGPEAAAVELRALLEAGTDAG